MHTEVSIEIPRHRRSSGTLSVTSSAGRVDALGQASRESPRRGRSRRGRGRESLSRRRRSPSRPSPRSSLAGSSSGRPPRLRSTQSLPTASSRTAMAPGSRCRALRPLRRRPRLVAEEHQQEVPGDGGERPQGARRIPQRIRDLAGVVLGGTNKRFVIGEHSPMSRLSLLTGHNFPRRLGCELNTSDDGK